MPVGARPPLGDLCASSNRRPRRNRDRRLPKFESRRLHRRAGQQRAILIAPELPLAGCSMRRSTRRHSRGRTHTSEKQAKSELSSGGRGDETRIQSLSSHYPTAASRTFHRNEVGIQELGEACFDPIQSGLPSILLSAALVSSICFACRSG
jgi:hypothetical protein